MTQKHAAAPPEAPNDGARPPADDAALVREALADPVAFAPLYRAYQDRVYWYLLARTGNTEDAADLTQQTFLKALDALAQYHPRKGPFVAWLFAIARNAATNFRQRARPTVAWDFVSAHVHTPALPSVEESLVLRESLDSLLSLLATLDSAQQELLALRFVAGLTSAQIAAIVGKSEAATKKQLTRILHSLKEQYHEIGE